MKKITLAILFSLIVFLPVLPVFGQTDSKPTLYFFGSPTCPHCLMEKAFLDELEKNCAQVEIVRYDFAENLELAKELYQKYNVSAQKQGFVPVTFIGNRYFIGFNEKIGQSIENYISELTEGKDLPEQCPCTTSETIIEIPFFGKIDIGNFSLPALAVVLGTLDGFSVCSLGALVLILGLTLALKSKKKILIFGGIYVLTTIIIYGFLIFLWHQLFVFVAPYIKKMEILIGLLSLAGAVYFLKEFFKVRKKGAVCQFGGISDKFSKRVQGIFERKTSILVLAGAVLLFGTVITIVEFPCSAVLPAIFSGILAGANLPLYLSLLYIGIYVLFYMLDELAIFLIAVFTMKIWILSPRFIVALNLFASILLFLLAFYYFAAIF
ncbi:MAG: thioredoxin family protein [Candidatus Pacebacteria bacterium]|nr:thioredoxin family protein [Candidatus Paceibacterota bacterium]